MILKRYEDFKNYKRTDTKEKEKFILSTKAIIDDVRENGDSALIKYSRMFDNVNVEDFNFLTTDEEIESAINYVKENYSEIFELFLEAAKNVKEFHEKQLETSYSFKKDGALMGMKVEPLDSVLAYVPGGKAFYPSTAIMNIVPAKVAGVKKIFMTTPPDENGRVKNPLSIAIAVELGVDCIYKLGGAHAIAAFTYGTESIPAVAKIVGPGNIYVATAKKLVMGVVGIDSIAGPSEVMIFADEKANPDWVAIDLCAQAEHTGDNMLILVSTSMDFIKKVESSLEKILPSLKRKELIRKSLENFAFSVFVKNYEEGFEIVNLVAPEHVEVIIDMDVWSILKNIRNAGAIFIGEFTPVALGDYFAGPNHVLPTNGTAVFSSPLGVYDFVKRSSFLSVDKNYILKNAEKVVKLAFFEELDAHASSILFRTK